MEQFNETKETGSLLALFRAKMEARKRADIERGAPAHLFEVDMAELTDEDREVWDKVESGSISREELGRYRNSVLYDERGPKIASRSRKDFLAFINNVVAPMFLKREENESTHKE